jgi:sialate O-acetylesterase
MSDVLTLHELLSDHAVLQRDRPIAVYGTAQAGAAVSVDLAGERASVRADERGAWQATLAARPAGGTLDLVVTSDGARLERRDLVVGDVWIASGQSNMEWSLSDCVGADEAIAQAADPGLRLFTVPRRTSTTPAETCGGAWVPCTSESANGFSGVAYFFARKIREAGVPVGVICAAWGGTRIASWLPGDALDPVDDLPEPVDDPTVAPAQTPYVDAGNEGEARGWADAAHDDAGWSTLRVPGTWQSQGHRFNGSVWLRRAVDVPREWAGKPLVLELGAVDDFDVTYWNGRRIGGIGPEVANAYAKIRRYPIDAELVRAGRNVIAVRVFDQWGDGGIVGPAPRLRGPEGASGVVSLAGEWRMKIERALLPWLTFALGLGSSVLYNGMIHPLRRSPVRGFLWYQGESDASTAQRYRSLFARQIARWRSLFREPSAPFLFVQLAGYGPIPDEPGPHAWGELREAQASVLSLPETGMAVALDVGDPDNIHPRDKRTVGERLACWALARVHGRSSLEVSGPTFRRAVPSGAVIRVELDHARGLSTRDAGPPLGLEIAGADRVFRWADAAIEGEALVVSHPVIAAPIAVRYGWSGSSRANLKNAQGLPAAPFRSDDWSH